MSAEANHTIRSFAGAAGNALVADVYRGAAPACLFLHGGGQTRHSWQGAARRVNATGLGAVAVDQRGHGNSDWVEDGSYAFVDFSEDVLRLAPAIASEFGGGVIAIGASLGGLAALLAELKRPGSLEALVLVDVVPWMEPSGVEKIQGFMGERSDAGFASLEEAAEAIAAYLPHRPRPKSLEGLRKNLRLDRDGRYRWHWDPRFLNGPRPVNTDRAGLAGEIAAGLPGLDCPVLLVRGARSELVTEQAAERFLREVPHAAFVDVSDAGHMVAGDSNDAFSRAVVEFVSRIGG